MGWYRGGDHDRVDRVVREQIVDAGGQQRRGMALAQILVLRLVDVAEPEKVAEVGEVPDEILSPLPETDLS